MRLGEIRKFIGKSCANDVRIAVPVHATFTSAGIQRILSVRIGNTSANIRSIRLKNIGSVRDAATVGIGKCSGQTVVVLGGQIELKPLVVGPPCVGNLRQVRSITTGSSKSRLRRIRAESGWINDAGKRSGNRGQK